MRPLLLSRIANWTGGRVHGTDVTVGAVSIDTRTLAASGEHDTLFVAIKGERFDGHDHAAAAVAAGARALLVARPLPLDVPQIVVADTERALGDFAGAMQRARGTRVAAVTGSNGSAWPVATAAAHTRTPATATTRSGCRWR